MSGPQLAIIADDLTGALDSSAPFAGRGLRVTVALGAEHLALALAAQPDVIAVTTGSREIPADAATDAVRRAVAGLPAVRIFKKVDSRLKGHVAAELDPIPFRRALMAPAIPEFGRIVRDGCLMGFGVPVPIPVAASLGRHAAQAEIPDTETAEQMRAALESTSADLLIGARGLAEALAVQMTGRATGAPATLPGPAALFVIGSRDPITLAQVARLREAGGFLHVDAPNGTPDRSLPDADRLLVQAQPGAAPASGHEVGVHLACAVAPLLRPGMGTALLTGGATAEAVLRHRAVPFLTIRGECLPGLVASDAGGLTIVTKSGGFGTDDSLIRLAGLIGEEG
ncbi:four-carbon acid sugar kinase family protein [Paracoccus sp. PAR01]|uniref:four-carbon acid sugar kinase family protein n=1 Tax=Paracoccus sp. PAR01 TaxID=2769282 RepID=UPI00178558BE|nr:four-carbon acid sugar kinase family protein [Paracoccus sp. PAR01]MBD9527724.1 four-carbon acid sugar kinase family protein [Paracoccus sp. PAR01]